MATSSKKPALKAPRRAAAQPAKQAGVAVLVGTKKGLWILRADAKRKQWATEGPHFYGCIVNHAVVDPRDNKTILASVRTGHLGPTLYRSTNGGKKWEELNGQLPKFKPGETLPGDPKQKPRVVEHIFWLEPGAPGEKGVWYAGTSPAGLFRTENHGTTWEPVPGWNDMPKLAEWIGWEGVPDVGQPLHSICVDPRDPKHLYVGISCGGAFETRDRGETWTPINRGCAADFMPKEVQETAETGHDPHCMRMHPLKPDRLYQQNHCGIYKIDRPNDRWERIGNAMPKKIGDVGFPIVLHPRDPDTVWVFPMDGGSVWPRVSIGGKPAVFRSKNAGKSWTLQNAGLPKDQGWFTVKRQCFSSDANDPLGVYFGTTSGEVWASANEGDAWKCIAAHLPHIYSVTTMETRA